MESIEEFAERYSEVNEAKLFIERFKQGALPLEYIPSGFRLKIDYKEIDGLIDSYGTINEEEYNRILCTYYAKYLNEKYFNNHWVLDEIPCKPPRNKCYFNDKEIDFYDLYNLLIQSISYCRSFAECEALYQYNMMCKEGINKLGGYYHDVEHLTRIQNEDMELNGCYVLEKHPEFAYLYSDKIIYQRINQINNKLRSKREYSFLCETDKDYNTKYRNYLINTIDELSILNEELKKRTLEEEKML